MLPVLVLLFKLQLTAQVISVSSDAQEQLKHVVVKNTREATCLIRLGEVDSLGFGWPGDFDPPGDGGRNYLILPWEINEKVRRALTASLPSSMDPAARLHRTIRRLTGLRTKGQR